MNLIKFFRGPKNTYQGSTTHKDAIYFATDTHELYMNGASYGDPVKSIAFSEISNGQDKGKVLATVELSSGKTFANLDTQCYGRAEIDSIITEINSANTSLGTRMTTAEGRIDTLSADSSTQGSVAYQIAEIVNENNNGSIDTLNEIASWIINDTTGAAKMAADIETLKTGKVDKVTGKQLSTEDYTTAEKTKLAGIEAGAQVNPTNVSAFTNDSGYATTTYVDTADTTTNTRVTTITGQSGSTYTARATEGASYIKNSTSIQGALNDLDDAALALTTLLTWQEIHAPLYYRTETIFEIDGTVEQEVTRTCVVDSDGSIIMINATPPGVTVYIYKDGNTWKLGAPAPSHSYEDGVTTVLSTDFDGQNLSFTIDGVTCEFEDGQLNIEPVLWVD